MGFFDFFLKRVKYEDLMKLEDEYKIREKLNKLNIRQLTKICLTKCKDKDLDTEYKQKELFINAIIDSIKKEGPTQPLPQPPVEPQPISISPDGLPPKPEQPDSMTSPLGPTPQPQTQPPKPPMGGKNKKKKGGRVTKKNKNKNNKTRSNK